MHLPPSHLPCPLLTPQAGSFHLSNSCAGVGSASVCSVVQSCPSLFDPMNCSPPGSSVHEIFQARILEWVATSYSRAASGPRDQTCTFVSPALAGGFLPLAPPNSGSSLGFCRQVFPHFSALMLSTKAF